MYQLVFDVEFSKQFKKLNVNLTELTRKIAKMFINSSIFGDEIIMDDPYGVYFTFDNVKLYMKYTLSSEKNKIVILNNIEKVWLM